MKLLITYLPALGCAGAMIACVRMMGGRSKDQSKPDGSEIAELREEVARLRAQIQLSSGRTPTAQE